MCNTRFCTCARRTHTDCSYERLRSWVLQSGRGCDYSHMRSCDSPANKTANTSLCEWAPRETFYNCEVSLTRQYSLQILASCTRTLILRSTSTVFLQVNKIWRYQRWVYKRNKWCSSKGSVPYTQELPRHPLWPPPYTASPPCIFPSLPLQHALSHVTNSQRQ